MVIKNIIKYNKPKMYFVEENEMYEGGSGVLEVQFVDGSRRVLDVDSGIDITDFDSSTVPIVSNEDKEYIFKGNEEYYNEFYS